MQDRKRWVLSAARRWGAGLAALVTAAALAQVPLPPVEEKEDPKGGVKRKVVVEDDLPPTRRPAATVSHPPDVQLDELERAAVAASQPQHKALLQKYRVPFDSLTEAGGVSRIRPVPIHRSEWKGAAYIRVTPLDSSGQPLAERGVAVKDVRQLEYFEALVLADVEKLLGGKEGKPSLDDYLVAEQLLAAALRFHDYARERNLRRGRGWEPLRSPLASRLRQVRLDAVQLAQRSGDMVRLRELSRRVSEAYPQDAEVAQVVAAVRLSEAERLLQSPQHLDHVRARELLDDYQARFPGTPGETVQRLRGQLREMALQALQRAREKKEVGDLPTARDELARAAALDPNLEGLRELQRELRFGYPVLYVGVWQLPRYLSPSLALLDSEKQAVELLFEGLLEEVRDSSGLIGYEPAALRALPRLLPGGRECTLRISPGEGDPRSSFTSHDVVATVQLLRRQPHTWAAWPLLWLAPEPPQPRDTATVRLFLAHLHPDPRALLTFKLLPGRWLQQLGKAADDLDFAQRPFGTGPYRLHARVDQPPPGQPREVIFFDNPLYARSPDRVHLPRIREIRLVEIRPSPTDPYLPRVTEAFRNGRLHLLPDIPTVDLPQFTGPGSGLADRVEVVTVTQHRRIHILAVNLRRPYFQRKSLRQALSLGIDREDILDQVFRGNAAENRKYHRVMGGPFPPQSWAAGSKPMSLTNRDLAVQRLQEYLAEPGATTTFQLSYPQDDPRAAAACTRLKTQLETLFDKRLNLELEPVPMRDLLVRVHEEHRYDLAYIPFDYPDDYYPYALAALLDPAAATRSGRNFCHFLHPDTNPDADDLRLGQLLNDLKQFRDYDTLAQRAADIAERFNQSLPFIPLWQLDRHIALHRQLRISYDTSTPADPTTLNPTTLFTRIAYWRLE
jgi:peptide/nickel transport system substrate-binding protein